MFQNLTPKNISDQQPWLGFKIQKKYKITPPYSAATTNIKKITDKQKKNSKNSSTNFS